MITVFHDRDGVFGGLLIVPLGLHDLNLVNYNVSEKPDACHRLRFLPEDEIVKRDAQLVLDPKPFRVAAALLRPAPPSVA